MKSTLCPFLALPFRFRADRQAVGNRLLMLLLVILLLLTIVTINATAQQSYTLSSQTSGVYKARDYVRLLPGFRSSAAGIGNFQAAIDPRILTDATYQTGNQIPAADRPLNTSYMVGTTAGSADVSPTGAATYTIPITVPAGTGGIHPSLTVAYNSQSGNGLLGYGWSLVGVSMISRTGSTLYYDGKTEGVQLNNTDNLTIDEQRLLLISGINLTEGAVYHTEIENYSTVTMTTVNGKLGFEVKTKDGNILQYGASDDSYIEAQGTTTPICWLLTKATDVNGNYVSYSYEEYNASGEFRIKRIDYSGNAMTGLAPYSSMEFFYETRSDKQTGYVAGTKSTQSVILKRIKVSTNNLTDREYRFNYMLDGFYSKLTEVEEYGSDGSRYNSTVVDWNSTNSSKYIKTGQAITTNLPISRSSNSDIAIYGDFNGDGIVDICNICGRSACSIFLGYKTPEGIKYVQKNINVFASFLCNSGAYRIDINGDGKDEIIGIYSYVLNGIRYDSYSVYGYSDIAGELMKITGTLQNHGSNNTAIRALVGDFNGDGKEELFDIGNKQMFSDGINIQKITGDINLGGSNSGTLASNTNYYTPCKNEVYDFNGSGKAKIFAMDDIGYWAYEIQNGTIVKLNGFNGSYFSMSICDKYLMADFNGDGYIDILYHNWQNKKNYISYSDGTKFLTPVQLSVSGDPKYVAKVNKDNLPDVIFYNNGAYQAGINNGKYFVLQAINYNINKSDVENYNPFVGDFDNDGRDEIGYINTTTTLKVLSFPDNQNTLATSIINGLNQPVNFVYASMMDSSPYIGKTQQFSFPVRSCRYNCYLVNSMSDSQTTLSYSYKDAMQHCRGKGFLGFGEIAVTDNLHNKKSDTQYGFNTSYFNVYPTLQAVTTVDGKAISTTSSTNGLYSLGGKRIFPYLQSQTTTDNLTGLSATKNFVYGISNDGNPTSETETKGSITTTATYVYGSYNSSYKNRVMQAAITHSGLDGTYTSTATYGYDGLGRLTGKTEFAGDPKAITTSYSYDTFGNVNATSVSANGLPTSTTSMAFDATGRFAERQTDAAGLTVTRHYNALGRLEYEELPDGQRIAYRYNGFGTAASVTPPNGKTITTVTNWDGSGTGLYYTQTMQDGAPSATIWYDALAREVQHQTTGFNGTAVTGTKSYNYKGELEYASLPYYSGETPRKTHYEYDEYGRLKAETFQSRVTSYGYYGLSTTVTRPDGNTVTTTLNSSGLIASKTEPEGSSISYVYTSLGRPRTITANGFITTLGYDNRGYQTSLADPNMIGNTTYDYNAYGQLTAQKTPKGETSTMVYDAAGRLWSKTTPEASFSYIYNGTSGSGAGQLASIIQNGITAMKYEYSQFGKVSKVTESIDGNDYVGASAYDAYNRLSEASSPSGLTVKYEYDTYGYLQRMRDKQTNNILWQANAVNTLGKVTESLLVNGLIRRTSFDGYNMPQDIQLSNGGSVVEEMGYAFDGIKGTLTRRNDISNGRDESFGYDNLLRLTGVTCGGATQSVTYYSDGRINTKSDVGTYQYDAGKQQVLKVTDCVETSFSQQQGTNTYTSDNRISELKQNVEGVNYRLNFAYNPNDQRNKMASYTNDALTATHYYFGSYEKEITGGIAKEFDYIYTPDGMASIVVSTGGTRSFYTVNTDHLGSIRLLTDANRNVVSRYWYDAWGNRTLAAGTNIANRGYTGQEHLDQFGLINLNARLYDPKLAQFLGLDPLVQEPGMGQNFNRYSYCLNNPLLYSDPSGNSWISDAFYWVKKTIWDTPWRWLNGSDEGHPGVYSGGFSKKLDKWGVPSFGAGYNSSQGGFYYMGNNPRVYPAMEAQLQKQYAGVTAQTQAMIAGERQQRGADMAWQNWVQMANMANVGSNYEAGEGTSVDDQFRSYMNKFDRAVNMTCAWIIGDNKSLSYKNDDIANSFRNASSIIKAREDYYNMGITYHHVDFGLKGLFQAGLDPIEQFVGSYDYKIDVVGNNLQYTITNSTTFGSAAYHIWPYKWNWINGPMGTMNQTYIFTEPLRMQK